MQNRCVQQSRVVIEVRCGGTNKHGVRQMIDCCGSMRVCTAVRLWKIQVGVRRCVSAGTRASTSGCDCRLGSWNQLLPQAAISVYGSKDRMAFVLLHTQFRIGTAGGLLCPVCQLTKTAVTLDRDSSQWKSTGVKNCLSNVAGDCTLSCPIESLCKPVCHICLYRHLALHRNTNLRRPRSSQALPHAPGPA